MPQTVASCVWSKASEPFDQWSFVVNREKNVVTAFRVTEKAEPERLYAWSLLHADRYIDFLNTILQRFHSARASSLVECRSAIVLIQNEFAKALVRKEEDSNA